MYRSEGAEFRRGSPKNGLTELAGERAPTIYYHYKTWCPACQNMGPLIDQLAAETGVKVVKVDEEKKPSGVQYVPYIIYHDGKVRTEYTGMASYPQLFAWYKQKSAFIRE